MKTWMFLALFVFLSNAFAINLQKFHFSNSPVFATMEDGLLSDGFISTDYKYIFAVSYNYVEAPFIDVDSSTNQKKSDIIDWMHTLNIGGAFRFNDRFQIGVSTFFSYEDVKAIGEIEAKNEFTSGDTTIDFKYKFYEKNKLAIAFTPKIYLPTGDEDLYTSNGKIGYYAGFAIDKAFRFFQMVINLGHKKNNGGIYQNVDHEQQFHFSIGTLVPLIGAFDLTAEFFRDTPYDSDNEQVPSEINAGVRYSDNSESAYFAGVGSGTLEESEATDLRVYVGYKTFPGTVKTEKIKKEEKKFGRFYKLYNIYFKTGSEKIRDGEELKLKQMLEYFKQDPYLSKIVIEGYSSMIGSKKINKKLSSKRAKEVVNYLIQRGLKSTNIEEISYGNSKADPEILNKDTDRKVMFRVYRKK